MSPKTPLPAAVMRLAEALRAAGGRPYVVGGAVRDRRLGLPVEDYDVEVFGLAPEALRAVLAGLGSVNAVGEAFTVFKLSKLPDWDGVIDVSLPRCDSKVGPGHRGIAVSGDPELSLEQASSRRDFTINALLLDPFTQELIDPHGGESDLRARVLRAVDAGSFGDDPLRSLRAAQLAARYELSVEPATAELCAAMPLAELPAERIFGEIEKLFLKAARPSIGLALIREWGQLAAVGPELIALADTPQDPEWHPEGDVWTHTLLAMDEAAKLRDDLDRPRALALMLGVLCHDLGKPTTTRFEDDHIRSPGHEDAGREPTRSLLDRWNVHTLLGYPLRGQILALVAQHLKPGQLYVERERVSNGAIRRLAGKCEPELLYRVAQADYLARGPGFEPVAMEWFRERVHELDANRPPPPLLRGRDLLELGMRPGPQVGRILEAVYERQLDGEITTVAQARDEAKRLLSEPS